MNAVIEKADSDIALSGTHKQRHATLVSIVFRIQCTLWICLWLIADITLKDRNYNDRQNLLTTYSVVVAILNAQNDITFVIVAPSAHLSANSQERWFWLIVVLLEVLIQHHFEATKGQGSDMPIVHACAVHMQTHVLSFTCDCCTGGACGILLNLSSGDSWTQWGNSTNLFLSGFVITVPSWMHDFLSSKYSIYDMCRKYSHCKHMTYMTIIKLSGEGLLPLPLLPQADDNYWSQQCLRCMAY